MTRSLDASECLWLYGKPRAQPHALRDTVAVEVKARVKCINEWCEVRRDHQNSISQRRAFKTCCENAIYQLNAGLVLLSRRVWWPVL